jgi:mersacidin/lichenicidin family type 2 lantibiotic
MSHQHIIKAWKDPAYRNTLSPAEREALPANPAGAIEISDESLGQFAGGVSNAPATALCRTKIACTMFQECSALGCPTFVTCTWGCPTEFCTFGSCGNPIEPF